MKPPYWRRGIDQTSPTLRDVAVEQQICCFNQLIREENVFASCKTNQKSFNIISTKQLNYESFNHSKMFYLEGVLLRK